MKEDNILISCCLCGKGVNNISSHNAMPARNGRCCDDCNTEIVCPTRLKELFSWSSYKPTKKINIKKYIERLYNEKKSNR